MEITKGTRCAEGAGVRAFRPVAAVAGLQPYVGAGQTPMHLPHRERIAKLDWNECVRPPSPRVREALAEFVAQGTLNWYPDVEATQLRSALSDYTGVDPDAIRVFGGADAALEYIARTFLENDDEVVWSPPTYDNVRVYVESCGARLQVAPVQSIWNPEPGALLAAVTTQTRMVYLANPNNPTGTLYSADQIAALLWACPSVGFVVDEAYGEYAGVTAASLVTAHPNLMIVRSFAQAFGLAGLRIGYVLSHPDNLRIMDRIRVGKNTNSAAQVAAIAALRDPEYLRATVAETRLSMRLLADALGQLGLTVRTTPANFALVRVGDPETMCRFLANRLIFVRNRHQVAHLDGYIRITVGDTATTERVIAAFRAAPSALLYGAPANRRRLRMVHQAESEVRAPAQPRHRLVRRNPTSGSRHPVETEKIEV